MPGEDFHLSDQCAHRRTRRRLPDGAVRADGPAARVLYVWLMRSRLAVATDCRVRRPIVTKSRWKSRSSNPRSSVLGHSSDGLLKV